MSVNLNSSIQSPGASIVVLGLPEDIWKIVLTKFFDLFSKGQSISNFSRACKLSYTLCRLPHFTQIFNAAKVEKEAEARLALNNWYFDFPGSPPSYNF